MEEFVIFPYVFVQFQPIKSIDDINTRGIPEKKIVNWRPLQWSTDVARWKAVGLGSYWVTLTLQLLILIILCTGLNFIGVIICGNTYILVEIRLNKQKVFLMALKRIPLNLATAVPENIFLNNYHWVIYTTSIIEGITSWFMRRVTMRAKGIFKNMFELLRCIIFKWYPRLFWVRSNSKLRCMNLETNQVAFVLQVGAALLVTVEHIVDGNGDILPEILLALYQNNWWMHGWSSFYLQMYYNNTKAA